MGWEGFMALSLRACKFGFTRVKEAAKAFKVFLGLPLRSRLGGATAWRFPSGLTTQRFPFSSTVCWVLRCGFTLSKRSPKRVNTCLPDSYT